MAYNFNSYERLSNRRGICAICKYRVDNLTVDHILPRAPFKWTVEFMSPTDRAYVSKYLNSENNLQYVCEYCNVIKGSECPEKHEDPIINKYLQLYSEIKDKALHNSEGQVCYICKSPISSSHDVVLRRADSRLPRTVENAIVLCNNPYCHERFSHRRQLLNIF